MQRICWTLQVKKDRMEGYVELHKNVWPEMQEALQRTGWHNYSIFLRSDGLLIGYLETDDFQAAVAGMAKEPVNHRWQEVAKDYFEQMEGSHADEEMVAWPMVFHLD
jgi:L-rhamnose mutarotase